jgi:phosphatidylglycerophosphate synthase
VRNSWTLPFHAIAMLTAFGVSVVWHAGWPFPLGAALSFAGLVAAATGRWTPVGRLGPANLVTLLRLLLVLLPLALLARLSAEILFAMLLAAFVLDAVDGLVARRYGCASQFGAMLDGETDSALILVLGLVLWLRQGFAAWVLLPGTLRYVYLLCLALVPPTRAKPWRSRFGRLAFLLGCTLLLTAVVVPGLAGTMSAATGSLVLCASFAYSFLVAYPPPWHASASKSASTRPRWSFVYATLLFLVAWSFLNVMVNVRYPALEPAGWYFLPSLDVTLLLAGFALLGLIGLRLPVWARVPIVALFVAARGLRIGDGVTGFYFGKLFNLYTDLPLAPELVRYAHSTYPAWKFYTGAAVALAMVVALALAVDRAVAFAAGYLRHRRRILVFAGLVLPFAVVSGFLDQDPRYNQRYAGAFGSSVVPRFRREATFLLNVYDHQLSGMRAIVDTQELLKRTPKHLDRLHHANVYVMFVESYGVTVLDRPSFAEQAVPALGAMQSRLSYRGFTSASGRMESATYGGMSWLAHATFLTGVRTSDQLEYDLLGVSHPRSLARMAHEAGYYTILIQPNTNRQSHTADFYDFDQTYKNWDFDYAGPSFAWASMPDQYVLDFIRRKAIDHAKGPLFLVYNLISSHAPWSHVPTMVEDWSQVGNGTIYNNHPIKRAHTNWPGFSNAAEPYLGSILYDFGVIADYITRFVDDDSLLIVLGDHQPVSEITDNSPSWAVPVHVISRDPSLVEPFVARGYTPGMIPRQTTSSMDAFLVDFLHDFSAGAT